ncbi:MAG: leucine-rich repeat protein [Firmicutes bacterium]|nr:leucine-rich repeat protein [Bacillota bacterium]
MSAFADTAKSGTCGDNLTWTLQDGVLNISGTGDMEDYLTHRFDGKEITTAPWREYYDTIKSVVIEAGVTSIGNWAFSWCSSLTSVTIPESVTSIGMSAFNCCNSLTGVTIPDGVTSIGSYAFNSCSNLSSAIIPDSVTSIGNSAFSGCSSLTSVTIPDSVTSIGRDAFYSCSKLKDAAFGGTKEEWEATGYTFPLYVRIHYNCTSLEGHFVPMEVKETSCESAGYINYGCACGHEYKVMIPQNHNYVFSKTVAPTCSEHGYDLFVCSKCGAEKKEYHDDELLQHSYVVSAVEPSCLVGGYKLHKCSVCEYSYKDELVQPLGHSETNAEAKAPTCTEAGHTAGTYCSRCGKIMSGMAEIAALDHDFGAWKQTKAPTCTEKGTETRTCTRCNAFEIRDVAPTDHHYTAAVTAPTCTAQGYTTYTCSCGDSYVADYKDALGHSYKNGACTRCGAKNPNYVAAPVLKITTSAGKPKLTWNKVDGAEKYYIYRSTDGKNYKQYTSTTKTSYTNTSTTIGTTYYYKVKAAKVVNGKNVYSVYSNVNSVKCVPAAPVVSISRSNGKPKLTWKAVTGASKYYIYRSTDGTNFSYLTNTSKTSYINSGASSGTKYYYKVKAVAVVNKKNVFSAYSAAKNMMTTIATPSVSITTANGKPKLTWKAVTGADKYYVYRSTDGKTYKQLSTTTKTSLTNTGAKKNTKYYYKVKAVCSVNSNANSTFSNIVSIKATK